MFTSTLFESFKHTGKSCIWYPQLSIKYSESFVFLSDRDHTVTIPRPFRDQTVTILSEERSGTGWSRSPNKNEIVLYIIMMYFVLVLCKCK